MHAITLKAWDELTDTQRVQVADLRITNAQVEFSGTVARAITVCSEQAGPHVVGIALLLGERPVGFLILKRADATPDWVPAGAALLGGMQLDIDYQGQGLGQAALLVLPAWLAQRWPHVRAIVLQVDEGNVAGIRAYEKAGWTEYGERVQGRIGGVRRMARALPAQQDIEIAQEEPT